MAEYLQEKRSNWSSRAQFELVALWRHLVVPLERQLWLHLVGLLRNSNRELTVESNWLHWMPVKSRVGCEGFSGCLLRSEELGLALSSVIRWS